MSVEEIIERLYQHPELIDLILQVLRFAQQHQEPQELPKAED